MTGQVPLQMFMQLKRISALTTFESFVLLEKLREEIRAFGWVELIELIEFTGPADDPTEWHWCSCRSNSILKRMPQLKQLNLLPMIAIFSWAVSWICGWKGDKRIDEWVVRGEWREYEEDRRIWPYPPILRWIGCRPRGSSLDASRDYIYDWIASDNRRIGMASPPKWTRD